MNPFRTYKYINAEEIIKGNIRPDHISEDATSLLNALQPVTYIAKPGSQKAPTLHRNVIQKLRPKVNTLSLLEFLGYELNDNGDYIYRPTSSPDEINFRENVTGEFERFYVDLKKIKGGNLAGFKEFINRPQNERPPPPRQEQHIEEYIIPESPRPNRRLSTRASFRESTPTRQMPDYHTVQECNHRTLETIREFKEIIKPKHNGPVALSFIRRKLLLHLFKQIYPNANEIDDDEIDSEIDRRLNRLQYDNRITDIKCSNEVYYECLLRTNLNHDEACRMLRHNRPNLQPPRDLGKEQQAMRTNFNDGLKHIQEQWEILMENANENAGEQTLLQAGDEWKNTAHLVTTIIQLRKELNVNNNDRIINKMFRLIYSELSRIIRPQSVLKIEIFANALCEAPVDSIEQLSMVDIRNIVLSCDDTRIPDNFQENTVKFLATECPMCFSSYPLSRMEEMFLCRHISCIDCVKNYYRGAIEGIQNRESLKKLTCFTEEIEISDDVKMNFFTYLSSKLNQWFTNERRILDLYHENLYIATRNSSDKKCGNPQCAGFFYNENNEVRNARCPYCNFEQCQLCCRRWYPEHTDMPCNEYAEWLYQNDPNDPQVQLANYLNTAGMVCPNEQCKAVYEYQAGGCEHFTCPRCRTEFCRICSALFYNPDHNTYCPQSTCRLRQTLHAHCAFNCFREIRDATNEEIIELLTANNVNVTEELRQKPQATGLECPVEGCSRPALVAYENRFCETCYKHFLCLCIWRRQIEPWILYSEGNLSQKLRNAGVNVPENEEKEALIALARQHLTQFLGQPKRID